MKKIFILIILILISITGFSQLKPVYTVATDSTALGIALPKKTLVFDYGANVLYRVDTLGNMSSTIKTLGLDRVNSGNAVSAVNATYLDPNTCQLKLKIDTINGCNKVAIRGGLDIDTVMTMNGYFLLYQNEPLGNIMFGRGAGDVMIYDTIPHYFNTAIGINALNANKGDQNTAIGLNAGMQNRGNNNIFIGFRAANYDTTSSNLFVVNSIDRDTLPKDITHSIIYGVQNADNSLQTLNLNANVTPLLLTLTTITDTLTDGAPTDTELTAAIGMTATVAGKGASFVVIDADGSKDVYDVISNGTEYWYVKRTKAL